jgi:3-oxoacyl-[acyl-carrier protein] reductase
LMGNAGGSIINISSIVASMPAKGAAVYSATKAAVDALTIALSQELGPKKIRINSVNPGMIETEGLHATGIAASEMRTKVEAETPLGRIGQPDDIAKVVVFFATDEAGWITGQTLVLSGGQRM